MLQSLKIAVILLLVALVPARAIGSVTLSICAAGQEQAGAQHHEAGGDAHAAHDGHDQHDEQSPGGDATHSCSYCAAHCAGVAFAVPTDMSRIAANAGQDRIPFGLRLAPGFFPELLDRPPLVS